MQDTIQQATLARQAEQQMTADTALELERDWSQRETAVRLECLAEYDVERKSLMFKFEACAAADPFAGSQAHAGWWRAVEDAGLNISL